MELAPLIYETVTLVMEAAVNSLPVEILERIFSYCTHSDLVQSVQNVCCLWREVAESTRVWKDVTYCPDEDASSEQVVEMLEISPKLQNIILRHEYDDRVLQAITDNCAELRSLEISELPDVDMKFIKKLQEKCPQVEYLKIPYPDVINLYTCEVVGIFTNLKVLHLTGYADMIFPVILKPAADHCKRLEHLELENYNFKMDDLHYLLTMRKESLHTLKVSCCNIFTNCVLRALSSCELKSLSLFRYSLCCTHYEKIEHFGRLKTVKALSITTFSSEDLKQIFENENMAQLVELSLENSADFDNHVAEVILQNCPLLEKLSLRKLCNKADPIGLNSSILPDNPCVTDSGIFHSRDVKGLKCLRISCCEVGLGNIEKLSTLQNLSLEEQDLAKFPLDVIPHHMQYLKCLSLYRCRNVDLCAIEKLKTLFPLLKVEVLK